MKGFFVEGVTVGRSGRLGVVVGLVIMSSCLVTVGVGLVTIGGLVLGVSVGTDGVITGGR